MYLKSNKYISPYLSTRSVCAQAVPSAAWLDLKHKQEQKNSFTFMIFADIYDDDDHDDDLEKINTKIIRKPPFMKHLSSPHPFPYPARSQILTSSFSPLKL